LVKGTYAPWFKNEFPVFACPSPCPVKKYCFILVIGQFLQILEPSRELAMQLIELGRQHSLTRKLGVDMLRERFLHHDYVAVLLQEGYYLEALRYARKYKVITVQPVLFLEKAIASDSPRNVAAVLSFFSEFMPSFKTTSDYGRYQHILSEMV